TRSFCYYYPRCVKCDEDHLSESCNKSKDSPARCALCSGEHTANYKGCPSYKKIIKKIVTTPPPVHTHDKVKSKAKTYVEATSSNSTNFNFEPISNILSQFVTQLLPHYPTNFTFIDTLKLITI
ncbi:PRE C2HC domain-containing protein, partial [Aphis craccivora]